MNLFYRILSWYADREAKKAQLALAKYVRSELKHIASLESLAVSYAYKANPNLRGSEMSQPAQTNLSGLYNEACLTIN